MPLVRTWGKVYHEEEHIFENEALEENLRENNLFTQLKGLTWENEQIKSSFSEESRNSKKTKVVFIKLKSALQEINKIDIVEIITDIEDRLKIIAPEPKEKNRKKRTVKIMTRKFMVGEQKIEY